jgi:hypothetical protein
MSATTAPDGGVRARLPDPDVTALVVANLVPIVGVVAFDASALGLLTLYWLELGVVCLWALVRAALAGRPTERPGDPLVLGAIDAKGAGIPLPGTDAEIRLATLPRLLFVAPLLAGLWLVVGALVVGPVAAARPDAGAPPWLVVGAAGVFLAEGRRTVADYLGAGGYREHGVWTALRGAVAEGSTALLAAVLALLVATVAAGGGGAGARAIERVAAGPLVAAVVAVRLLTDLAGYQYGDRLGVGSWTPLGRADAAGRPAREPVDASLSGTPAVVGPSPAGRLLATARHLRTHPGPWLLTPVALLGAAVAATDGVGAVTLVALAVGLGVPVALVQLDHWLRYAGVSYRTDGTAVVAVDRLFRTELWRVEPGPGVEVRVERDPVDERLGTATVVVDHGDRPRQLPRLHDPGPIVDALAPAGGATSTRGETAENPPATVEIGRALARLDATAGAGGSVLAVALLALAGAVALALAAQFDGAAAAAAFVLAFATLPLVALVAHEALR